MPRLNPIQTSFSLGEITPRFLARTDIKAYKEGATTMENVVPLAQGPFRRRNGFQFAQELALGPIQAKIVPFPISNDDYLILVFYHNSLVVLNKFGETMAPELVTNTEFHSASAGWTVFEPGAATVVFTLFSCAMNPAAIPGNAAIRQLVTGLVVGQPYRMRVTQTAPLRNLRLRVGNAAGGFEIGTLLTSAGTSVFNFVPTATSHWIEVAAMTPNVPALLIGVSVQSAGAPPTPIASPFTGDTMLQLQFEQQPDGQAMYLVNGVHFPQQFTFTPPSSFALVNVPFIAPPASWAPGNYPRSLTFYQGRFWLGGTASLPSTFWGSKSNAYVNFTLGTLADDAVQYTIAKKGAIRWMSGLKALLIGTETQEIAVSSEGGVITPSDIKLDPQSGYGSSPIQPALLGNQVVYVNLDGRKLFSMGYRFEESGWVSTDIAFAAEHITQGRLMTEAFAQNPENLLLFCDAQGKMISCSYDRGNNIVGWHRHPSPVFFTSLASVKFLGTDIIWGAWRVTRGPDVYLQVGFMPGPIGSGVYAEAAKRVAVPSLTTSFFGFQHLAGLTAKVIADGAVHPDVLVSPLGEIVTQRPALEILAGLPTVARFVSLPVEQASQQGPSQQAMKRANRIFLQLLNSCRPLINGRRPPDRTPSTSMDTREPARTELIFVSNLGWDRQEIITVEEPEPIEMAVGGLFMEMSEEQS